VDSAFTSDSDEISVLLDTLTPLASSVHLCIIGSGHEYWAHQYRESTLGTLDQILKEQYAKLNNIAFFFQKKSFRHVRLVVTAIAVVSCIRVKHNGITL